MNDLNLSRMITVLATGSLLISAVGCGGKKDKDEDDEVPDKDETLEALCAVIQKCEPDIFDSEYDDVDDCLAETSQSYDDNIDNYGEDCGGAFLKFNDCWQEAWGKSCDEYAFYDECIVEILGVNANCSL